VVDIEHLYAELGLDFQPDERKLFLEEAAYVAHHFRSELGDSPGEADELGQAIEELMAELEGETVEFSPVLDVMPLRKKHFADHGLEVPTRVADLMRRFDFYLVHVPITLVPKPGWGFVQLDCIVEFNPGRPAAQRPVAHQVFPEEEWQDVIRASQGLSVGLDENLEFKVDLGRLGVELPQLDAEARATIEAKAAGTAGLILGPFDYNIRRPKVISRGRGNVKVRWVMYSEESLEREEPRLGVLLRVPKETPRVDVVGALKASRDFHVFTAHVRHLLKYVQERTRNFFKQGAPLTAGQQWTDITAHV